VGTALDGGGGECAQKTALVAQDFTRGQVRTSPGGGVSGATVVALPPDAVCKFGRCVVRVADQIIGRGLVVLGGVRRPEVLHGARGDLVGRGVRIRRRIRLGVSIAVVMWRGRLVVETVRLGGSVTCLHYDLIRVGRWGIKVPLLLLLLLLRKMGRRGRLGGAICSQGWRRFLELNLRWGKLDAFVRSFLPMKGVCALSAGVERDRDVYADALLLLISLS
jgi:hypothetical protein